MTALLFVPAACVLTGLAVHTWDRRQTTRADALHYRTVQSASFDVQVIDQQHAEETRHLRQRAGHYKRLWKRAEARGRAITGLVIRQQATPLPAGPWVSYGPNGHRR